MNILDNYSTSKTDSKHFRTYHLTGFKTAHNRLNPHSIFTNSSPINLNSTRNNKNINRNNNKASLLINSSCLFIETN